MKSILLVGLGGFIGSTSRYLISTYLMVSRTSFPWSTMAINVLGSFLIGVIMAFLGKAQGQEALKNLLVIGILGGFTTFSSFSWEGLQLLQRGELTMFIAYSLGSVILGLLFCYLGLQLFDGV